MSQRKQIEINEKTSMIFLAGPIFMEMLLNILLSNVDTVMLSNYSQNAVGAVGNANQIMFLFIILFNVIAGATGVVVAQHLESRKNDKSGSHRKYEGVRAVFALIRWKRGSWKGKTVVR